MIIERQVAEWHHVDFLEHFVLLIRTLFQVDRELAQNVRDSAENTREKERKKERERQGRSHVDYQPTYIGALLYSVRSIEKDIDLSNTARINSPA